MANHRDLEDKSCTSRDETSSLRVGGGPERYENHITILRESCREMSDVVYRAEM